MLRQSVLAIIISVMWLGSAVAAERFVTLASTTSIEQSGFFDHVLPLFKKQTGIAVRVIAVGSGQALAIGERGDADALLVHDRTGEEKFVAAGHGTDRRAVMFNDFIIVGPTNDPAGIRGLGSAQDALTRIAKTRKLFTSRGDGSGTHRAELRLWKAAGINPAVEWYRELGQGMGAALNTSAELNSYTISDRATWANFRNRRDLKILVEGDPLLFNPYSSILVHPSKKPPGKAADAKTWHEWITSGPGHKAIETFMINGEQVFLLPDSRAGSLCAQ
jgi:tungstate transport system substrate-binding protein